MPTFSNDLDIDIIDFIDACDSYEIKEIIEELKDQGHISDITQITQMHPIDEIWIEAVNKISYGRLQLTKEEEEFIYKLASKL
jgi:hypothetical protein